MTKDFQIQENLNRIVSTKNRLDALMISLVLATVFAFFYRDCEFQNAQIFGLEIKHHDPYYHYSITILLIAIFGLVGSHFIEYVNKRSSYDLLLEKHEKKDHKKIIRATVPGSFYEFTYLLKNFKNNDPLRELAVGTLLMIFFSSHYIAVIHIIERFNEQSTKSIISLCICSVLLIALYYGFVKSMGKSKKNLDNHVFKRIVIWLMISAIMSVLFYFI